MAAELDHRHSHALGTGVSVGVHMLIFSLVLFTAFNSPQPVTAPNVSIALLAPNLSRSGSPGPIGGSGMESSTVPPRNAAASPSREITPADKPTEPRDHEVNIPAMAVDATKLLPGSAIDIDIGRGTGPGAGSERGAGFSGNPGTGTGPAGDGGSGVDGFGSGDGITSPQLIREVKPAYTVDAMRAKIQGRVELDVLVLADGSVDPRRIRIVRSLDSTFGLDAQAIVAVQQWRFRPATNIRKQPVPVRVRVELTFTLR